MAERWVSVPADATDPHQVRARVRYLPDGTPLLVGLEITPNPQYTGDEQDLHITQKYLAHLPRGDIVAAVAQARSRPRQERSLEPGEVRRRSLSLADKAFMAARFYREGNMRGESPRKYIAKQMNCDLNTVNRYLKLAREKGYLPAYDGKNAKYGVGAKTSGKSRKTERKGSTA